MTPQLQSSLLTSAAAILVLPLAGFALLALFHKKMHRHGDWIAMGAMFTGLLLALRIFHHTGGKEPLFLHWTMDWLPVSGGKYLQAGILVDGLTSVMLVVVTLVSFLVHLFSSKYMEGDIRYGRYYASLLLFTTSMLGLILADNLLFLFIFWELVGLSSYVLIGHWYEKKSASDAAIKAFITTRIGDVGMLLGLLILYAKVGSLSYVDLFAAVDGDGPLYDKVMIPFVNHGVSWITLAGLGLFFGAMGKSAQFPLHVWLPDAMEGPTPVSALIHAATMVAAGVYLVGRLFPLFTPSAFICIAYIGAITAIFAASIALVQDDIKKVLAYSTLSQLGYMMLALGLGYTVLGGYYAGLFHLTTHAFFKAGLFLGSGSVIHAMHHEQSLSKYGGLWKKMPITNATYLLCVLAIAGFPFFSGFHSKDKILGAALQFSMDHPQHYFLALSGFVTAFMTAFYMFRQYFLTFWGKPRDRHKYEHAHESPLAMTIPLIVLAFLAVFGGGILGKWFEKVAPPPERIEILKLYSGYYQRQGATYGNELTQKYIAEIRNHPSAIAEHEEAAHVAHADHDAHGHHGVHGLAHYGALFLSIIVAFLGIALAWACYVGKNGVAIINPALIARRFKPVHSLLINKYYFDQIYDAVFVKRTHGVTRIMAWVDKWIVDMAVNVVGYAGNFVGQLIGIIDNVFVDGAVNGAARAADVGGRELSRTEDGNIRHYLLYITLGVVGLCVIFMIAI